MYRWALMVGLIGAPGWGGVVQGEIPQVGDAAPGFKLEQLDGGQVVLNELKGKIVLMFFLGYD